MRLTAEDVHDAESLTHANANGQSIELLHLREHGRDYCTVLFAARRVCGRASATHPTCSRRERLPKRRQRPLGSHPEVH